MTEPARSEEWNRGHGAGHAFYLTATPEELFQYQYRGDELPPDLAGHHPDYVAGFLAAILAKDQTIYEATGVLMPETEDGEDYDRGHE